MTGPRRSTGRALVGGLLLAVLLVGAGCTTEPAASSGASGSSTPSATVRPQYVALAEAVAAQHGRVWVEADLVKAWQAGPAKYAAVLATVVRLADRPGVAGVKIADELGYGDGTDQATVLTFLAATTKELHARLPGQRVLVDVIVPELGCLHWPGAGAVVAGAEATASRAACAEREVARNPAASVTALDAYVARGGLDVLNVSAGLRSGSEYAAWGTTRDAAMAAAWDEASRRWGTKVRLQARKALAHPGAYAGTAATAEADVHTFVDVPLTHGAKAVDIWTWSQPYRGTSYTLTDPGLAPNALTAALLDRRRRGVELWTHMTPSSLQVGLDQDVASALTVFSDVLVASGTG